VDCSGTRVAHHFPNTIVNLASLLRSIAWAKRSQDHEHGNENRGKDHQLAENGSGVAQLLPLHAALTEVLFEFLTAKFVVDETTKCNAVSKGLKKRDGVLEEKHGCEDQENILEDAGESEDKGGGLANLRAVSAQEP